MGGKKQSSGGGDGGAAAEESRRAAAESQRRWEDEQRRIEEQRKIQMEAIAAEEARKKAAEEARLAQEKLEKDNQQAAQVKTGFLNTDTLNSQAVKTNAQANLPAFSSLARRLTAQRKANTPAGGPAQSNALESTGVGLG